MGEPVELGEPVPLNAVAVAPDGRFATVGTTSPVAPGSTSSTSPRAPSRSWGHGRPCPLQGCSDRPGRSASRSHPARRAWRSPVRDRHAPTRGGRSVSGSCCSTPPRPQRVGCRGPADAWPVRGWVAFLDEETIVTAATQGELLLWNASNGTVQRRFPIGGCSPWPPRPIGRRRCHVHGRVRSQLAARSARSR